MRDVGRDDHSTPIAAGSAGSESEARSLDERDPFPGFRERFHLPRDDSGAPLAYFCGNSLGLKPRGVDAAVRQELDDWARLAVDGHFEGRTPWYTYHETLRQPLADLVGARPEEVVAMNGLTVNLHLMMVSFYRPTPRRYKILMEHHAFPSDSYAIKSQLAFHGHDPAEALLVAEASPGEDALRAERIESLLEREGERIALVLIGGVQYYSGQCFDMQRIARVARHHGCVVGFDLAHAVGNVPLALHDWGADFAVWCSYKYLNGGPGAVAGCFVHQRHLADGELPRFAGWWGNDPQRRFRMHLEPEFVPVASADGWQLSNPPVLAMAPLRASLALFEEAGSEPLRAKSLRLTDYLLAWVDRVGDPRVRVLTPRAAEQRGCQVSLFVDDDARALFEALKSRGIVGDYREPGVIRLAPVPMYNSYHDVWRFGRALGDWAARR
jgi:kynureninase